MSKWRIMTWKEYKSHLRDDLPAWIFFGFIIISCSVYFVISNHKNLILIEKDKQITILQTQLDATKESAKHADYKFDRCMDNAKERRK